MHTQPNTYKTPGNETAHDVRVATVDTLQLEFEQKELYTTLLGMISDICPVGWMKEKSYLILRFSLILLGQHKHTAMRMHIALYVIIFVPTPPAEQLIYQ